MILSILGIGIHLVVFAIGCWYFALTHSTVWGILVFLLAIIGVYILSKSLWTVSRSILSRLRFCSSLKQWAKNNDYECSFLRRAWVPFFKAYSGEDIVLKSEQKAITLSFFPISQKSISSILSIRKKRSFPSNGHCFS